jgi:hypothetical protein
MRLGRLWIALAACLVLSGIASAQVPDPILVLGNDPAGSPIPVTSLNFAFGIDFGTCTSNCDSFNLFQNQTGQALTSLTIDYAGGGLTCQFASFQNLYNDCGVGNGGDSVTWFGLDATHEGIQPAICDPLLPGCVLFGGGFSIDFQMFNPPPGSNGDVDFSGSATTAATPEPATMGLIFSGLGTLLAGWKRYGSRRSE